MAFRVLPVSKATIASMEWFRAVYNILFHFSPPQFTVATLPTTASAIKPQEGDEAFATNGRKVGEGVGAGTGVPVYYSNGAWRVFSTDAAVAA